MTRFKIVVAAALAALLVPVAAVAKEASIEGPMAVAGSGFFGGELEMATGDEQRPVRIKGIGGYVGFLDLAGDLKVRCAGKGRVHKKETEEGVVYLCAGRGGQAVARGSHFKLRGFALRYRALFPAGVTGTLNGRFTPCTQGEDGWECAKPERRERPEATERKRGEHKERPAAKEGSQEEGEIPTLSELAEMLAGK